MRIVCCTISNDTLCKECVVRLVDKLDFAAAVELVHDLAHACPHLLSSPVLCAVTFRTGCRRDLEEVHSSLIHQCNIYLLDRAPDII